MRTDSRWSPERSASCPGIGCRREAARGSTTGSATASDTRSAGDLEAPGGRGRPEALERGIRDGLVGRSRGWIRRR